MEKKKYDIAIVGLGVMGRNLLLNIADHGFSAAGYDRDAEKVDALKREGTGKEILAVSSPEELLAALSKPRTVLILVPAGAPVDDVIGEMAPKMDAGDLVIDAGNSHFTDTDRRAKDLAAKHLQFLGTGVSGGESGARFGPSIMPGGDRKAYDRVRKLLEAISAKVDGEPCVAYLGPGSAGHYVKMMHNGIEYALMQLIAESYDILSKIGGLGNDDLAETYGKWNESELGSFLIEITSKIFTRRDEKTGGRLVDMILDSAKQKGTGRWASQDGMEINIPIPSIDAAVSARELSAYGQQREEAGKILDLGETVRRNAAGDFSDTVRDALHFAVITAYAQGFSLLGAASETYAYNLNLADIAVIWRGGCIIRASLLDDAKKAFREKPGPANLMLDAHFAGILKRKHTAIREATAAAIRAGIPVPAFSSSIAYFDGYRSGRLPANLIQAQRDFFGSHTYERTDAKGTFHTEWQKTWEE